MKVTVDEHKKASADEYPKLMVERSSGCIVFFAKENEGIVVRAGPHPVQTGELGHMSSEWRMNYFTDFHGTITLEND